MAVPASRSSHAVAADREKPIHSSNRPRCSGPLRRHAGRSCPADAGQGNQEGTLQRVPAGARGFPENCSRWKVLGRPIAYLQLTWSRDRVESSGADVGSPDSDQSKMHYALWARMRACLAKASASATCASATYATAVWVFIALFACASFGTALGIATVGKAADESEGIPIAKNLAAMLSAGLIVISNNQTLIDNPDIGDKGLDGKSVLEQVQKLFRETTGTDPSTIDPNRRHGRLLRVEMDAIVEVMNAHQRELNQRGIGFKGFVPSTFGRLVAETFNRGAQGDAELKMTAPMELVRNRKARPDQWESFVIREKFTSPTWPKGEPYAAVAESKGRPAFRVAVPEYYTASCLACHGGPEGQIDITGYPKEGRHEGDLGGIYSITLYR